MALCLTFIIHKGKQVQTDVRGQGQLEVLGGQAVSRQLQLQGQGQQARQQVRQAGYKPSGMSAVVPSQLWPPLCTRQPQLP